MKVKQLHLQNYGRFEDLTIDFAPTDSRKGNVTVIVGNNGAGKSQILQAMAKGFYLFIEQLNNVWDDYEITDAQLENQDEKLITPSEVRTNSFKSSINMRVISENIEGTWNIFSELYSSTRLGMQSYNFDDSDLLSTVFSRQLPYFVEKLPIMSYYSVHRANNLETYSYHHEDYKAEPLDGYLNAIESQIDFDYFVRWFKRREDIENAEIRKALDILIQKTKNEQVESDNNLLTKISALISDENMQEKNKDNQLQAVKSAIIHFLDNLTNVWIDRESEPLTMKVSKENDNLDTNQLSQGEKSLLALVGDIARRLAILNPSLDDPLQGEGVVMIDEVDLHLHPKWQHDLIDKLVRTFPNVQFILTTHSPHIISDNPDILVYALNDGELTEVPNIYGEDVNTVLSKVFEVDIRDGKVQESFDKIYETIAEKRFVDAEEKLAKLEQELPTSNLELLRARLRLTQAKLAETEALKLEAEQ